MGYWSNHDIATADSADLLFFAARLADTLHDPCESWQYCAGFKLMAETVPTLAAVLTIGIVAAVVEGDIRLAA